MLSVTKFWIWLSVASDPAAAWLVYRHFGSPETAYFADTAQYRAIEGLEERQIAAFGDKSTHRAERILADCHRLGVHISTWQDADYPERLRNIHTPPLVLYFLGRPLHMEEECVIAMAGTRRCSSYGCSMARKFAYDLTKQGALVVTGMASGCDEAALVGAMQAGGPVAALLPGGVDVPFYDNDHYRQLYRDVAAYGTLVSTYPPGTPNDHSHFRFRNPVLTGLSVATLCIEASNRSGVLHVAACAQEQQRTLYTIPANLTSSHAAGTNALLCSGLALPVMSASDLLLTYQASFPQLTADSPRQPQAKAPRTAPEKSVKKEPLPTINKGKSAPEPTAPSEKKVDTGERTDYIDLRNSNDTFTDDEQAVLLALQTGDRTGEELIAETNIPSPRVMATLTLLTLRGYVEELSGGRFRATVRVR